MMPTPVPKKASANLQGSQAATLTQIADLRAFEIEFEQALRTIEERADLRSKEFDEEGQRLAGEMEAEFRRTEMYKAELMAERRKTMIAQSNLSAAENRLVALEQTLDAVEDEVEETIQTVELRVALEIAEMERRLREEVRRRETTEADQGRMQALEAEVAQLRDELAKLRASMSWSLTAPFRNLASWFGKGRV